MNHSIHEKYCAGIQIKLSFHDCQHTCMYVYNTVDKTTLLGLWDSVLHCRKDTTCIMGRWVILLLGQHYLFYGTMGYIVDRTTLPVLWDNGLHCR